MARAIQEDTARAHPLFACIAMRDAPKYPGAFVARLVADAPTAYALLGQTLAELQAQLPRSAGSRGGVVSDLGSSRGGPRRLKRRYQLMPCAEKMVISNITRMSPGWA